MVRSGRSRRRRGLACLHRRTRTACRSRRAAVAVEIENLRSDTEAANLIAFEFAEALAGDLAARPNSPVDSLQTIVDRGLEHEQLIPVFAERACHAGTQSTVYCKARTRQTQLEARLRACFAAHGLDMLAYPEVRQPPTLLGANQAGSNASRQAVRRSHCRPDSIARGDRSDSNCWPYRAPRRHSCRSRTRGIESGKDGRRQAAWWARRPSERRFPAK